MGLNELNARRINLVFLINLLLQARLRFRIGRGDAIALAVLIDAPSLNDPVNNVLISLCIGQPFQQHDAHGFSWNNAICPLIEGVALALGREHACLRRFDMQLRPRHHKDTPGQGQIAAARGQTVTGMGYGDQ